MQKFFALVAFLGLALPGFGQSTFTVADGYWDVATNWSPTGVPTSASGAIFIDEYSTCRVRTLVTADEMTVRAEGTLIVENGGRLDIMDGTGTDVMQGLPDNVNTNIPGIMTVESGGIINNSGQISFLPGTYQVNSGGEYRHNQNGNTIPAATWNTGSTCRITGWANATLGTPVNDFRASLGQSFYHFIWDSQTQAAGNVSFEGALTNVAGNLTINHTNTSRRVTLGFIGSAGTATTTVGGDFIVGTLAKVSIGSAGSFTLNVGGNVQLSHVSASPVGAYILTNAGNTVINIAGGLTVGVTSPSSLPGQMQMTQGAGSARINIGSNLTMNSGAILRGNGGGADTLNFTANNSHLYTYTAGTFDNVDFFVGSGATLNLSTYQLGSANSRFTSDGTVVLGSINASGAVSGNIVATTRTFNSGSTIVYGGSAGTQFMGADHPTTAGVNTTINNSSGVSLVGSSTIGGNLTLQTGSLTVGSNTLTLGGNLTPNANTLVVSASSNLTINGAGAFGTLPVSGSTNINNFTVNRSTSGVITLGTDLTIDGTFSQVQGRVDLNNHTLTINGTYTGAGSLGTTASSNLIINGSGPLPGVAFTANPINIFTLNRPTSILTTTGTLTATTLNLTDGDFSPASFNMAAGGTITVVNGFISTTPGSSGMYNVIYNNASPITGSGEIPSAVITNRLNNVTVSGGSTVVLPNDCVINGNINIASGSLDAQSRFVTLRGNFTANSSGALNNSTFTFDGNTTISGSAIPEFANIILPSARTLSLPAQFSVAGDIQFTAGATLTHNNGTITLTGTTDQDIAGGGLSVNNLTANKATSTNVTLTSSLVLLGTLDVLSTNTEFKSDGFLHLISTSDGTTGNARIGPLLNGTSVTGDVIVDRFMSAEGSIYRYISAPVSGESVAALQAIIPITGTFPNASTCTGCLANPSMFSYNGTTSAYVAFPAAADTETMIPGVGYAMYVRQNIVGPAATIPYQGPANQGDISLPVVYNGTATSWNLVGNPYPASIDWDFISGWTKTGVSGTVAVHDNPGGGFRYWDGAVSTGIDTGLDNGEIAQGQAFWVRTTAGSPVLTIHEPAKTTVTGPFYREGNDLEYLSISVVGALVADRTVIRLDDNASVSPDDLDAPKLDNEYFDLSTRIGSSARLAINVLDRLSCDVPINLDIQFTKNANGTFVKDPNGAYNLSFQLVGSGWASRTVKLVDNFTGTSSDVNGSFNYPFSISTADAASFANNRFSLSFSEIAPHLDLSVSGSKAACDNSSASITVAGSQPGYDYYVVKGSTIISEELRGTGSDLNITFPTSTLTEGDNEVVVMVKGVCKEQSLVNGWTIFRQTAAITVDVNTLTSNFETGNQWLLNNEPIEGATGRSYTATESGVYQLTVSVDGCTSSASQDFIVTGDIAEAATEAHAYPNPVTDILYIDLGNEGAADITIQNELGNYVKNMSVADSANRTVSMSMNDLAGGIYFVRVTSGTTVRTIKIVKISGQ